jgi:thymidylate synthase
MGRKEIEKEKTEIIGKILGEKCLVVGKEKLKSNEIPSIMITGETIPEVWENSVLATLGFGAQIPTEYDQQGDPKSKDASLLMVVTSPFSEPRIHRGIPGRLMDLSIYTQEIVKGVRDHRVSKGGSYSYHDRLFSWPGIGGWQNIDNLVNQSSELPHCDQVDALIKKLSSSPHSRRAQAITWNPLVDAINDEPPCLQRIWCRVVRSKRAYLLEMNTHWRSRDALKAAFMNMYALTELQKTIADEISELSGHEVLVGRYLDFSDSYHIYGSDVRKGETERFLKIMAERKFEDRTWRTDNYSVQREFGEAKGKIEEELRRESMT